jgi:hypothetical protein
MLPAASNGFAVFAAVVSEIVTEYAVEMPSEASATLGSEVVQEEKRMAIIAPKKIVSWLKICC